MNDQKVCRFSHDYEKLPENWADTQVLLLSVSRVDLDLLRKLAPAFVEFDTRYRGEEGHYNLDFSDALILIFVHLNSGGLFSTIRRATNAKEKYYRDSVLSTFELVRV